MPHDPVAGFGWRTVALDDLGFVQDLLQQLELGLKVIHKQPHCLVQMDHRLSSYLARVAVIADEPADYRTVLLLDPGLVLLA